MGSETRPGLLEECNTPIKASQESISRVLVTGGFNNWTKSSKLNIAELCFVWSEQRNHLNNELLAIIFA